MWLLGELACDEALLVADWKAMGAPSGTVTFLFTDIEGSTRLWQLDESAMRAAVRRHDELLRAAIGEEGGTVFSTMGDGIAAAFPSANAALRAAIAAQERLAGEDWPTAERVRVRMGLHSGEAEERDGDFFGTAVNRAARLTAIGHGGQVLCSSATAELVDPGVVLIDLGEHRLRDLDRHMHVFQVGHGLFSPLRSLDAFPGNLPTQLTSFIGRERELKGVSEALLSDRLVTVTGTGGVGKTRLALQAAADAMPSFPDGVWVCELAATSDPESMLALVATNLGSTPRERAALVEGIAEFIGDRRLLLILDNCEHLLDPAAKLAERVLAACRQAKVLATSREALDVAGERVYRLRPLEVPEADAGAEEIVQVAASRLFIERADTAGVNLELNDTDTRAIAEICRRLDGIPLAIELAAARTIAMSPTEVGSHLDERFRLLTGGRRAAVERHQTLRATIDWSYSALKGIEQRIFDCLGVFPASFDAEAARAVAAHDDIEAWDVLDALTSLVAKSILSGERTADGSTRYQMLESLRAYARERLEARGAADRTRRRHAQHFASMAEAFRTGIQGPEEAVWKAKFYMELDNLRSAALWSLDSTDESDSQLAAEILLSTTYAPYQAISGMSQLAAKAVDQARHGDPRYRPVILAAALMSAFYNGDLRLAAELAHEALADGIAPGTPAEAALVPLNTRLIFAPSAEIPSLIADGSAQLRGLGASNWVLAHWSISSAMLAALRGHLELARQESTRSLELIQTLDSPSIGANACYAYALAWWQSEPNTASERLESSLPTLRGINPPILPRALALLGQLRAFQGHAASALEAFADALRAAHANSDRQGMATVLARGIPVLHAAGRDDQAATLAGVLDGGLLNRLWALPKHEMPGFEDTLTRVAASLGHKRYDESLRRGRNMSYSQIVAFSAEAAVTGH
jgi:predicted ATPase/class 3 adenylate cyclase